MADFWDQFADAPPPPPPAPDPATLGHGEDYLKNANVPNEMRPLIKQVAEYKAPYPAGFLQKTPFGQQLVIHASNYNPEFDATVYDARKQQRKNYEGGGKQYQEMQAINTVAGHFQPLMEAADKLDNFQSFGPLNSTINSLKLAYGEASQDPRITRFNLVKDAVSRELTKAYQGGHITDNSVLEWKKNLNAAQTPEQLRTAIGQLNDLLMSKRSALEEGYRQTMGSTQKLPSDFSSVNDRTRKIFENVDQWARGVKPEQAANPQAAAPALTAPAGSAAPAAAAIPEGATATNPQTGAKIQYRGGQWVPAQ